MTGTEAPPAQREFPCKGCGASLQFAPGTDNLKCPYCGFENRIQTAPPAPVPFLDFFAFAAGDVTAAEGEVLTVHCHGCGAESTLPADTTAGKCPFCAAAIVAEAQSKKLLKPQGVLPFVVNKPQAQHLFKQWIASLWFAPSTLSKCAQAGQIDGVYIPAWVYYTDSQSAYTGERGEDYWTTETYTERDSNGRAVTRTRQVKRTRWYPASGMVANHFDDVLVLASQSLPRQHAEKLPPWDLPAVIPYADEYLAGFVAQSYQVDLVTGFETAKAIVQPEIRRTIESDIGGDHQRIFTVDTKYFNTFFKHILLPLWISAYRYQGKTFRFLINARTGKVHGERPYSFWKIAALVLAILVLLAGVFWLYQSQQTHGYR